MNNCVSCGYENIIGASFCSSCGTSLTARKASDDVTASYDPINEDDETMPSIEDLPEGTLGVLVVHQGPKRGTRIALSDAELVIGRDPECDIFLDDITVSRRHSMVRRNGSEFEVSDLGSMNGTYINKTLVETVLLRHDDELQIGKFKLIYWSVQNSD